MLAEPKASYRFVDASTNATVALSARDGGLIVTDPFTESMYRMLILVVQLQTLVHITKRYLLMVRVNIQAGANRLQHLMQMV